MQEIAAEFEGIDFNSERLEKRFVRTYGKIIKTTGQIAAACKRFKSGSIGNKVSVAIYRLLANEKIEWEEILRVHRESTEERMKEYNVVLAVKDTTSVNYNTQRKMEGNWIGLNNLYVLLAYREFI